MIRQVILALVAALVITWQARRSERVGRYLLDVLDMRQRRHDIITKCDRRYITHLRDLLGYANDYIGSLETLVELKDAELNELEAQG